MTFRVAIIDGSSPHGRLSASSEVPTAPFARSSTLSGISRVRARTAAVNSPSGDRDHLSSVRIARRSPVQTVDAEGRRRVTEEALRKGPWIRTEPAPPAHWTVTRSGLRFQ